MLIKKKRGRNALVDLLLFAKMRPTTDYADFLMESRKRQVVCYLFPRKYTRNRTMEGRTGRDGTERMILR